MGRIVLDFPGQGKKVFSHHSFDCPQDLVTFVLILYLVSVGGIGWTLIYGRLWKDSHIIS